MEASYSHDKETIDPPDWISELRKLTEDQVKDLAKSDTLSKLIACGQTLWLVTQVVSRLCQHQAVTLLEVSTCAYVLCALLSYAAWWKKPQGIALPIIIACSDYAMSEVVRSHDELYCKEDVRLALLWAGRDWFASHHIDSSLPFISFVGMFAPCPTLFGAIHAASWSFKLPSYVEFWMWRVSSIYCLVVGVAMLIMMLDEDPKS